MSLANKPIHPTPANLMGECSEGTITMAHCAGMTLWEHYYGLNVAAVISTYSGEIDLASLLETAKIITYRQVEALNNG